MKDKFLFVWGILTADKAFKIYYLLTFIWFIQVLTYVSELLGEMKNIMASALGFLAKHY